MISTIEEAWAEDFNPYTLNLENLIPSIVGMQRGYSWIDKQVQYFQISNILEIHTAKIFRIEVVLDYLLLPALVLFKVKRSPEALSRWLIRVFGEIKAERYWSILTSHWIVAKICKV
jgi:hypothetical protein